MRSDQRKRDVKLRKNFFPTLMVTLLLWGILAGVVYFVEPDTFGAVPAFFLLILLALLFTFSTLFAHTRRGLLTALGLTFFFILRYLGVGNLLNFLLLLGTIFAAELYFSKK